MLPISICIIAKNEEKHLQPFLSSIKNHMKDYPHEIVFVDTGSTDATRKIASQYTDCIYDFKWINDFSAARNFSLSKASHDWVLVLDCDEYITSLDPQCFQQMMEQYPTGIGMITRQNHYQMNEQDSIYTDQVERFFNRNYFHYESIIHEQVVPLTPGKTNKVSILLTVDHCGYMGTIEELQKKVERNNTLLLQMLEQTPDDPYLYFQLGQSYNAVHDVEKTCLYYGKGLEYDINPQTEYAQLMVIGYGHSLLNLKRYEEALLFEGIYNEFSFSADFLFLMGLIYMNNAMFDKAIQEFMNATRCTKCNVKGINSYLAYYNIGVIYECAGMKDESLKYYKMCGDYEPALNGTQRCMKGINI